MGLDFYQPFFKKRLKSSSSIFDQHVVVPFLFILLLEAWCMKICALGWGEGGVSSVRPEPSCSLGPLGSPIPGVGEDWA